MEVIPNKQVLGITGASGFIGKHLSEYLLNQGFIVLPLNRNFTSNDLKKCDIIINLAGASINKRWSKSYKKEILNSRLDITRKITSYIKEHKNISLLINASAVGIYSSENKGRNDEYKYVYGNDFLANVCKEWENEALSINGITSVTIIRLGLVLSDKGGALPKMSLPAKFGVATVIGKGDQIISWIKLDDLLRAIKHIIENNLTGVVNMCSPNPIKNKNLTKEIAKKYNSLITIRIPSFFIKIIMGEASAVIVKGQYVISKKLIDSGFTFISPFFY